MTLPDLVEPGVLPWQGSPRHRSTHDEILGKFVVGAPSHQQVRRRIWTAYRLWEELAAHHFGHGEIWLSGTFLTYLVQEPTLRVVLFPSTPSMVGHAKRQGSVALTLLTLEDLFFMSPAPGGTLEVSHPVGGMIDSAIGATTQSDGWDVMWSMVKDARTDQFLDAGYVSLRM
jgi:hypothetical protein